MINIIILSAGNGKRMFSDIPKVLHKIANKEMLLIVNDIVNSINIDNNHKINKILITSQEIVEKYNEIIPKDCKYCIQHEKLGTGHATKLAFDNNLVNDKYENTLILYADNPLITKEILKKTVYELNKSDVIVFGFNCHDQGQAYGRIFVENNSNNTEELQINNLYEILSIKEFKNFKNNEIIPTLCNAGIVAIKTNILKDLLPKITNQNVSNEYYLTDIIALAKNQHYRCKTLICKEEFVLGVNSKTDLAHCESIVQNKLREFHLNNGVTLYDPSSVYFSFDTKIGRNVIIEQNVVFKNNVTVCDNVNIKSFSYLENVVIDSNY